MIKSEHVIAVHLLGKCVLVIKVVGFRIGRTLNDGELYLFELLAFDTCSLRDSFLCMFEDFALSIELVFVRVNMGVSKTYRFDQENERNPMRL
jgi:hypothetical protein